MDQNLGQQNTCVANVLSGGRSGEQEWLLREFQLYFSPARIYTICVC